MRVVHAVGRACRRPPEEPDRVRSPPVRDRHRAGLAGRRTRLPDGVRHRHRRLVRLARPAAGAHGGAVAVGDGRVGRSEEHTSELQSLMRISYAVFCLKKKKKITHKMTTTTTKASQQI